jgi:hypothetical protein
MSELSQFEALLSQLMAGDNNIRNHAEKVYNQMQEEKPDQALALLIQAASSSQNTQIRMLCFTYIRTMMRFKDEWWEKLTPQTTALLKQGFIKALESETDYLTRRSVADALACFVIALLEESEDKSKAWPEFLSGLFAFAQSPNPLHRENAISIMGQITPLVKEAYIQNFESVRNVIGAALVDPQSVKVRVEALNATIYLLVILKDGAITQQLQAFVPAMLEVVAAALNAKDIKDGGLAIQVFIDLIELDFGIAFVRPCINQIVTAMFQIAGAPVDNSLRQLALEFLVALTENRPAYGRKLKDFPNNIAQLVLSMMLEMDEYDLAEWNAKEEDMDELSNADVAEDALDRLSMALGGTALVPVLFAHLPGLLTSAEWKHRYVGLMIISLIGEGCAQQMEPLLPKLVPMLFNAFTDAHPRVRWAVANTIGRLATDFAPEFQEAYYSELLPRVLMLFDDKANPRVQSHAAACLVNWLEKFESKLLAPFLDVIMDKLMLTLRTSMRYLQEQSLTTIASVATCSQALFIKYYDMVVPILKTILIGATGKDFRLLRAKSVETMSIIGMAVGKEKFTQDAREIMQLMVTTQQSVEMDPDDPLRDYMLRAYARICKVLGADFVPYMQYVMPPLMASAGIKPTLKILPFNMTTDEFEDDDIESWKFMPVGEKYVGVHTTPLNEKATAVNMILSYADDLKEEFYPYLDDCFDKLKPMLHFYYHDGVRGAAAASMPHLMQSLVSHCQLKGGNPQVIKQRFDWMLPDLLKAAIQEPDIDLIYVMVVAVHEVISVVGEGVMSPEQMKQVMEMLKEVLSQVKERLLKREAKKVGDDVDDEEKDFIDELQEKEDMITTELADCVGIMARYYKQAFVPIFHEYTPLAQALLGPETREADKQLGLCMFDDIIEHGGQLSAQYVQPYLPVLIGFANNEHNGIRQASVYGLGVCAQHAVDTFKPFVKDAIQALGNVVSASGSRDEENACPTENAISAFGKICYYHGDVLGNDLPGLMATWLNWQPLVEDDTESLSVLALLCQFIESKHPHIFGNNLANVPQILKIFAKSLGTIMVNQEVTNRIRNTLGLMQQAIPEAALQAGLATLTPEEQAKFK